MPLLWALIGGNLAKPYNYQGVIVRDKALR